MELVKFLLDIEQVGEVDVGGAIGLVLELGLGEIMGEVLAALAIAGFGVDEEKEVKLGCFLVGLVLHYLL